MQAHHQQAVGETSGSARPPGPLLERYRPADLVVFTPEERRAFLGPLDPEVLSRIDRDPRAWEQVVAAVAWDLLYRLEPELYARLTAGERLHPGILEWIPARVGRAVEVGSGWGRLTRELAPRCRELVAVEPAGPLREGLERLLDIAGCRNCTVCAGFLDAIPLPDGWADMTFTCSSFSCDPDRGGDRGLAELDRVTRPGGLVVMVWPPRDRDWLVRRGFELVDFPGELSVEFQSVEEAVELAAIFYPHAVLEIAARGRRTVPCGVLGIPGPRSLAWRRMSS